MIPPNFLQHFSLKDYFKKEYSVETNAYQINESTSKCSTQDIFKIAKHCFGLLRQDNNNTYILFKKDESIEVQNREMQEIMKKCFDSNVSRPESC